MGWCLGLRADDKGEHLKKGGVDPESLHQVSSMYGVLFFAQKVFLFFISCGAISRSQLRAMEQGGRECLVIVRRAEAAGWKEAGNVMLVLIFARLNLVFFCERPWSSRRD